MDKKKSWIIFLTGLKDTGRNALECVSHAVPSSKLTSLGQTVAKHRSLHLPAW